MKAMVGAVLPVLVCLALGWPKPVLAYDNDAASAYCISLKFESDRFNCLQEIRGAYFDDGAVAICRGFTFQSDSDNCFAAIRNRTYSTGDIAYCAGKSSVCLAQLGAPFVTATPPAIVVQQPVPVYTYTYPVVVRPYPYVYYRPWHHPRTGISVRVGF